ncbi:Eukaryotic translation initiation factor 3 subunit K [Meloidogyne graminicola]|uniref:Eukaryotic translation initiation factor 3 subunit K n=1 Tax=Meloidogyne graminicola TaxID=189291 RepID=A0A8S9ZH35_9BILA|nr:Eukaryotic translation initiation factor 3 subunit K [Meloidogyne graminicola]
MELKQPVIGQTFDEARAHIDITGINRYNPTQVAQLEYAVQFMISETKYDKDILMTLLKLYQLNPNLYNEKYVCLVLLKTMTNFPRNDFALAKYLLEADKVNTLEVRRVLAIGALLESCNFVKFWRLMNGRSKPNDTTDELFGQSNDIKQIVESIKGFKEAIRNYACQVISVTYQRIYKQNLVMLLGDIDDNELAFYASHFHWRKLDDEDVYFIQNHEDTIKSRNIEEKLQFEQKDSSSIDLNNSSTSSINEGEDLGKMLNILRDFLSRKYDMDTTVRRLRARVEGSSKNASLLFDLLVALQPEFDEERKRKDENDIEIKRFLEQIGKEILPF